MATPTIDLRAGTLAPLGPTTSTGRSTSAPPEHEDGGDASSARTSELAFLRRVAGSGSGPGPAEPPLPEGGDWAGPRFTIGACLGRGGFGSVHEAFDHQRQAHVALKTAIRRDAAALSRFKHEFRALAELVHPHLVELYELHGDDDRWFFTMELVRGQNLLSALSAADDAAVRSAFHSLAAGLCFLHESGRVHRDIKPSNVMLRADGRVVILDFGLAVDLTDDRPIVAAGTPRYMPPEALTGTIGPAADWYAVGVMLRQVLARRPPCEDLQRLCLDLLSHDPAARPLSREVLARLESSPTNAAPIDLEAAALFVGRKAELERLHAAFACARAGRTVFASVEGPSGVGKTALVARALAELRAAAPDTVTLEGRCFEQESVPYQAVDSLIDELGRYLARLPTELVQRLLAPEDAAALLALFPALAVVKALRAAPATKIADKIELRRRALQALRELLRHLAARGPIILWIDDLHWGDVDGGALLVDLFGRASPPLLFIASFRGDERERSECLRLVLPALGAREAELTRCELVLPPLSEHEALCLAERALSVPTADAQALARESAGSPLLVRELCRFVRDTHAAAGALGPAVSLAAMITARVAGLPEEARRLLALVALCAQPVERGVAGAASQLGDDEPTMVALLRRGSLIRTRPGGADEEIEVSHDRIREDIVASLAPETRRAHHRALARALAASGRAEDEVLASHLERAGSSEEAAQHWERAADQAFAAHAFDRAARLVRQALAARTHGPPSVSRLHARLGEALTYSGRAAEAARAYLDAARDAEPADASELRRRAAEQYLWSGHVDEGFALLRSVVSATGLRLPRTALGFLVRTLGLLVLLRLRGLKRRPPPTADSPGGLARIDAATSAHLGLGMLNPVLAIYFRLCSLDLALRSRDSLRLLVVLVTELAIRQVSRAGRPPTPADREVERLIALVRLEVPATEPRLAAIDGALALARGLGHLFRCELALAHDELERGVSLIVESPIQYGNLLAMTRIWLGYCLYMRGAWRRLAEHLDLALSDARQRGDRFAEEHLGHFAWFLELVADRPDAAAALVRSIVETPRAVRSLDAGVRGLAPTVALYRDAGIGDAAHRLIGARWALVARLLSRLSPLMGISLLLTCARAALAAAAATPKAHSLLRRTERAARELGRIPVPCTPPLAAALRAGVAACRGDRARAQALLIEAEAGLDRLDLRIDAAAARWRRGELTGGVEGAELVARAGLVLAAEGVKNPARMVALYLPGRWS